jgi:diadenosine tetraphosphate (Ap4A) HIT family hydrolase
MNQGTPMGSSDCRLCDPDLGPVLAATEYWRLVLNENQDLLGRCFLACRRHVEPVKALSPEEWNELLPFVADTARRIDVAFAPDHYNFTFLQNVDRHAHLHVIPRYASPRRFRDLEFGDPGYPGPYAIRAQRQLGDEMVAGLVEALGD